MALRRSALQTRAACAVRPRSAPTSGAISTASAPIRAKRSACEPSLLWKVTDFRPSSHSSMPALATRRSFSQKNRASDSRAFSTLRLPFRIVAPWSAVSVLATVTKPSIRPGLGIFHREELLVFAHRGLQHLGRQMRGNHRRSCPSGAPAIPPAPPPRPAALCLQRPPSPAQRPDSARPARWSASRSAESRTTKARFSLTA